MNVKHTMQRRLRRKHCWGRWDWPWALCLVCLPGITGCTAADATVEESEPESPVPVRVANAELTTLRPSIDLVGMLVAIPERTAVIAAQTEGRIQSVSVVEGATVKSGQTLLQLDTRPAEALRLRAEAEVSQKQAVLDRLVDGYLPQEVEIAKQDVRQAKAELESLRLRVRATAKLHDNQEVSDVEYKNLQSTLRRKEATYAAAAAKLELYQVGTRPEKIAEAQAQLDAARADLVSARLAEAFCTITSPFEGVVTQQLARQGMHVAPSDRLATVVDLSQVFVRIRVPSGYLSTVEKGARVMVTISSLREKSYEGIIERFTGEADPNTGDVQAFALLQNEDGLLRPGLACRVRIWLPAIEQALVVPISAVADREGSSVLHVVRDNRAFEVPVGIGASTREYVQITDGLTPDDVVITEGGYGLPEGCPVKTTSQ